MKKNVQELLTEMNLMLNKPSLTLENFIIPEKIGEDYSEEDMDVEMNGQEPHFSSQEEKLPQEHQGGGMKEIEKELTEIRKIALSVITRLADNPSTENYVLMKKIWNTVDKAIENTNEKTVEG